MRMRESHHRTGGCILVMPDKYRPGHYVSGMAPSLHVAMTFVGGHPSYQAAFEDARRRYREARRERKAEK